MADFSTAALENLRASAQLEQAPSDLVRLSNRDLLEALALLRDGKPTVAALLLAGKPEALARHLPHYAWSFFLMGSDTAYRNRADGRDPLPLALGRLPIASTPTTPFPRSPSAWPISNTGPTRKWPCAKPC